MHFSADGKDPMESGISEVGERGYFPKQEHFFLCGTARRWQGGKLGKKTTLFLTEGGKTEKGYVSVALQMGCGEVVGSFRGLMSL